MSDLPERYHKHDPEIIQASSFPGVSLYAFMQQTEIYEQTAVALSPLLRQAARVGILLTLLIGAVIYFLPSCVDGIQVLFFPLFRGLNIWLSTYLHWLAGNPWLIALDALLLAAGLLLMLLTRNLRYGKPVLHWLACTQALGGTANLSLLLLPLALLLANVVGWIATIIVCVLLFSAVVGVLGRAIASLF